MKKKNKKQPKVVKKASNAGVAIIKTDSGVTAIINGKNYSITSDHPQYYKVVEAIHSKVNGKKLAQIFATANSIKEYSNGKFKISSDLSAVYYRGHRVHNSVERDILRFMREDLPVEPLLAFTARLYRNPSMKAIETLNDFRNLYNLPITDDGCVLAYKGVDENFCDMHTHSVNNCVGSVPKRFKRNEVDDNDETDCSKGYHAGSFKYASSFGPNVVVVKVAPEDVVVVPKNCRTWKFRTLGYEVVALCEKEFTEALA